MALRFVESFDHYPTAMLTRKWSIVDGSPTISNTGRRGGGALRFLNSTYGLLKVLDSQSTWIVGMAFKTTGWPTSNPAPMIRLLDGTSTQILLQMNTNGTLSVLRNATVLSTSSYIAATDMFIYVELKATIHDSTGSYEVRVNGATVTSGSGVDTQNSANASANRVQFHAALVSLGIPYDPTVDDIYICDGTGSTNNDFLGDCRVDAYFPNGNGNSSQMVGSDGNSTDNYLLVDETSMNSDTDYVESSTVGNKDTYAFGDISHTPTSIFGVQINLFSKKSDAGLRSIQSVTRSGGTDTDGTARALSTEYSDELEIRETDPNTSAAWTISGFNAAEFGAKVAA